MAFENISSDYILTKEQLNKHFKVYAGPGAGKTHFLVENIKEIVSNNEKITKSNCRKLLCITYTNAAVDEINTRLKNFSSSVEVNTIHGFIIDNIILPFQQDLKKVIKKDFAIDITGNAVITSQIEGLGVLHGYEKEEILTYVKNKTDCENIDYSKKIMGDVEIDIDAYLNDGSCDLKASKQIDTSHKKHIKEFTWNVARKLTHNEILYLGYRLLMENSTVCYALRVKFPYIFVDEFQDTNPLQTLIIKLLGSKSSVLGIIGDVAQSIYSFQGAKPSQFNTFSIDGERELEEYHILDNRRSTSNIVKFSNYFRKSDVIVQNSIRQYNAEEEKEQIEKAPVRILVGESTEALDKIDEIVKQGGVVLTRTWVSAFRYMHDVDDEQKEILKSIYNSYFVSSIDIRKDIEEHNRVTWVRAFKFIIMLYMAYSSGSFVDVLNALSLYCKVSSLKKSGVFTSSVMITIKKLLSKLFAEVNSDTLISSVIDHFNILINSADYLAFKRCISTDETFTVPFITEYDAKIEDNLTKIKWNTARKLFDEVFSPNGKYITVHQAKGLEWDKVVVSVSPSRNDKTTLSKMYQDPKILGETPSEEFTRIYYVACTRAKNELYIHVPDDKELVGVINDIIEKTSNNTIT